jgi:hypothetical protein
MFVLPLTRAFPIPKENPDEPVGKLVGSVKKVIAPSVKKEAPRDKI